eukprot:1292743-Rhodomonas_salina.1
MILLVVSGRQVVPVRVVFQVDDRRLRDVLARRLSQAVSALRHRLHRLHRPRDPELVRGHHLLKHGGAVRGRWLAVPLAPVARPRAALAILF